MGASITPTAPQGLDYTPGSPHEEFTRSYGEYATPFFEPGSPEADFIKSVREHTQDSPGADSFPADSRLGSPHDEFTAHYGDYTTPFYQPELA